MLEVSSGLLDVFWNPFGSVLRAFWDRLDLFWGLLRGLGVFWRVLGASWHRLGACLRGFWSILGLLVVPLEVSPGGFSDRRGCLGGDIAFGVGFLMLCGCLGDRFSLNLLLKIVPI